MLELRFPRWAAAVAAGVSVGAAALLVACGGGGGDTVPLGSTAGPTAATYYAQGAISGFGSIIVGGVHFDESAAAIADDDGNARSRSALRLGMMVQIDADHMDRARGSAQALRIRFGSEVLGPVDTIDTAGSTLQVLGQTVLVTESTVFDETLAGGLSALAAGSVVEVHGILDPANDRIVATRIEVEDGAIAYKLRGVIAGLDATAKTFTVGGELVSYAGVPAATLPALANGQVVRVQLQTAQVDGAWVATALRTGERQPEPRRETHLEGAITAFTSHARFEVSGIVCDASGAGFPDGTAGIVPGARVEVEGRMVDGVLVASKVEVQERRTMGHRPLELHGDMGAPNAAEKTFALRGVTVWYGGAVVYRGGTEADLAEGRRVEVRGVLSADRTRLEARLIEFR